MKENKAGAAAIVLMAVIGIISILSYMEVRELRNEIESLETAASYEESIDYDEIERIVTEGNQKDAGNIEDIDVKYLAFDAEKKEGNVRITITPKKFDVNGNAYIKINDSSEGISMERNENCYVCEIPLPAGQSIGKLSFYVQSGGEMCSTVISEEEMDFQTSWAGELLSHVSVKGAELSELYPRITFAEDLEILVEKSMMDGVDPVAVYERKGKAVKEIKMEANGKEGCWNVYFLSKDALNAVTEKECNLYVEVPLKNDTTARQYIVKGSDDYPLQYILNGKGDTILKGDGIDYGSIDNGEIGE